MTDILNSVKYSARPLPNQPFEATDAGYLYEITLSGNPYAQSYVRTYFIEDAAKVFILDRDYWGPDSITVRNLTLTYADPNTTAETDDNRKVYDVRDVRATLKEAILYVCFYKVKGKVAFQVWECKHDELENVTWRAGLFLEASPAYHSRQYYRTMHKDIEVVVVDDTECPVVEADVRRTIGRVFTQSANDRRVYLAREIPGFK